MAAWLCRVRYNSLTWLANTALGSVALVKLVNNALRPPAALTASASALVLAIISSPGSSPTVYTRSGHLRALLR